MPEAPQREPLIPRLHFQPELPQLGARDPVRAAFMQPVADTDVKSVGLTTRKIRESWQRAPGDLKLLATVIPLILLLTLNAAGPRLYTKPVAVGAPAIKTSSNSAAENVLMREWHGLRRSIAQRAGFDYVEDFRSGLDAWTLGSKSGVNWSYDNVGFVRPGALALYRPALHTADCEIRFTGQIEQKALGFVFRAVDSRNYEAVRFVVTNPALVPEIHIIRYAVVNGREGPKTEKPLPTTIGDSTSFTVRAIVRGNDFTLMVQGKVADSWADERLKTGSIGFFCRKGESARVWGVSVAHQDDTLGRICAYIAPERVNGKTGVDGNE